MSNKGTATYIGVCHNMQSDARHYHLDPPLDGHQDVVVSAVVVNPGNPWIDFFGQYGAETYIFPANEVGEVTDWGELEGSFHGDLDHIRALENAGYVVV